MFQTARYRWIFLFLISMTLLLSLAFENFNYSFNDELRAGLFNTEKLPKLELGDLVLREGTATESLLISKVSNSKYSHIGIVTQVTPTILVTHATNDNETQDKVRQTPIDEFFSKYYAYSGEILRLNNFDKATREHISNNAKSFLGKRFNMIPLESESGNKRLYCTSIIYDSIRKEVPSFKMKWSYVNMAIVKGSFLFPSEFENLPKVQNIYSFTY